MILVDTSIWIDHLNHGDPGMADRLGRRLVFVHPFVAAEVALGSLRNRNRVLDELSALPSARVAEIDEMMTFIDRHDLGGTGVGFVDVHLLASVRLMPPMKLWTRDRRLRAQAARLGVVHPDGTI